MDWKGKNILFISPSFFGYEKSIQNRLRDLGANVDFFDERPANTFWTKAIIRINHRILAFYIKKYYKSIYSLIRKSKYDYVFVVNIEAMPKSFLKLLKKQCPSAKFILYMWDSIMNKKYTESYLSYFDIVYSFDPSDCQKNNSIRFRPLFFLNEYQEIATFEQFEYDLCFIGTAHSDRFSLIRNIQTKALSKKLKIYWFLYLPSRKLFIWNKIYNSAYRKAHLSDFNYKPLSSLDTMNIIKKSKIVLDIQHPGQSGLTMRTIEMLGARRKLITTNASITNYDFYSPHNILVIDRKQPVLSEDFCNTEYKPINNNIYYKYSLDGWLEEVFDIN